jgi:threonylcarbamoyladenosine tRNA methylthiotransferase MtaB
MRRRYKRELYAERVAFIKQLMPHCSIGVDVIVGFPGETDADFRETAAFLAELDVSYLHVFTYSERNNTLAAEMKPVVPPAVRQERNAVLRALSDRKAALFIEPFRGTTRKVLLESVNKEGRVEGYTDNYIKVGTDYDEALVNKVVDLVIR